MNADREAVRRVLDAQLLMGPSAMGEKPDKLSEDEAAPKPQRLRAPRIRIARTAVEALPVRGGRYMAFDSDLPGFGVEVFPSGQRVYRCSFRVFGRLRQLTLGRHGTITPDQARALAKKAIGEAAHGRDPAATKAKARHGDTFGQTFDAWLSQHVELKRKQVTAREYRRLAAKHLADWRKRPLGSITRAEVTRVHRAMVSAPYAANRVLAVVSAFFSWAAAQGLTTSADNPARGVEKYSEERRECLLSADDLARLGRALEESEGREWPFAMAAIRLLIFTGARRNEILDLRWEHVDLNAGTARLPDSKTGRKTIHFAAPARDLLTNLPRLAGNPYVIPGRRTGHQLVNLQRTWVRVRKCAGLEHVRIHDLRHAFASVAATQGQSLLLIGRLLGHAQPQTTDRYAHLAASPMVSAADRIAGEIARHMRGQTSKGDDRCDDEQ